MVNASAPSEAALMGLVSWLVGLMCHGECERACPGTGDAVYARTRWSLPGQSRVNWGPMLRLRTFGGLTLSRGEENLTGAVTQRRRLALLALLAVARDTGLSRDKLLAWLWPDSDAERARHVLNQLLYAQRRQVGDAALFTGQKTLRLNRAVM